MVIQNHDELRKWIECAQMAGHSDPNEFLRHFEKHEEFGFSIVDFYGWIVVIKSPYLEAPHVDCISQPVSCKAELLREIPLTCPEIYMSSSAESLRYRNYLSQGLVRWFEIQFSKTATRVG